MVFIVFSYSATHFHSLINRTTSAASSIVIVGLIGKDNSQSVNISVMSNENYYKLMRYERYGGILMLALVASGVLGKPLSMAIDFIYSKMLFIAQFGCDIVFKMFYAG